MKFISFKLLFGVVFLSFLFLMPTIIFAAGSFQTNSNTSQINCSSDYVCLDNPLGDPDPDINKIIGNIIKAVLGIIGSISLAMFTYGGFVWLTSAGNTEKVQKGKAIFTWGTVGMIIILTAAAFVRFVLGIFG